MLNGLAKKAQSMARSAGVILARRNIYSDPALRLQTMLSANTIEVVLDVGANRGQYAMQLISAGFAGRIVSVEAMPELHAVLRQMAPDVSSEWIIAEQCAISDRSGTALFNITAQSASSSLLTPGPNTDSMPEIFAVERSIEIPTKTIAEICSQHALLDRRIFLKLDIQGAEKLALIGAVTVMSSIHGIVVEAPVSEYYEGQEPWRELDKWITGFGFELWDIEQVWRDPRTAKLAHVDMTYFRPNAFAA